MESGAGGRFYARKADGSERPMGEVLAWEPPSRLTYSWFPGTSEALPTEIDIFFSQEGDFTRVDVTHRELVSLQGEWPGKAAGYDRAWDHVLPAFAKWIEQGE